MVRKRVLSWVEKFSVLLLFLGILPNVFPMVTVYVSGVVWTNIFLVMWLCFVLSFESGYRKKLILFKNIFPILFLYIIYIVSGLFGNPIFGNRYMGVSLIFYGNTIYQYYKKTERLFVFKYVFIMLLPFVIFTTLRTTVALIAEPYAARLIKCEGEESMEILKKGISGYSLIYFLTAMAQILLYIFLNDKKHIKKVLAFGAYVYCFFVIIISNYFTALLCVFITTIIMLILYFWKRGSFFAVIMMFLGSLIVIIAWEDIYKLIINLIMNISYGGKTVDRLTTMQDSFFGGLSDEMQGDRLPRLQKSFDTFLKHPLTGIFVKDFGYSYPLNDLGQHSHILDTLAIWGILLGGINMKILFSSFNAYKFVGKGIVITLPILIVTVIIFGLNNAINSVALAVYFIYPYVYDYYK